MATAIASLVRSEPVSGDVGMTGEITLTGQVLPIGGLREKSLAAERAGLKRVIVPRENEPDLEELPPETKEAIEFVLVDSIDEAFAAAFDGKRGERPKPVAESGERAARSAARRSAYASRHEDSKRSHASCDAVCSYRQSRRT